MNKIMCFCSFVALLSALSTVTAQTHHHYATLSETIVVDPSGLGSFKTIQAAIDSIPPNNQKWTTIHIKAGVYREQVKIPREKPFIHIRGEGKRITNTVWNDASSISAGATFTSEANSTLAQDITFTNSYNSHGRRGIKQAVAARISGDKSAFFRCGFFSLQDTLWDDHGRHYFKECTIHGAVDYIFGAGQSIYKSCTISVAALNGLAGFITAQARDHPGDNNGFVFDHCTILGEGKAFLGRPWRAYARVLFYNSTMSEVVVPEGWNVWDKTTKVNQLTLSEYSCRGPGAKSLGRVKWAKKLSEGEAKKLASISFIDNEGWVEKASKILSVGGHKLSTLNEKHHQFL